ncbi:MAG: ABC transporter permease [Planctomycetes bacterium]|nr:ABC transporter permease [Planctomycetota bacterium]
MYKLLLCQRYLRSRYIALASVISVTLGVATMIVVNAVMAGFSSEMRLRIQGILSDIIIETRSNDGVANAQAHKEMVERLIGNYMVGVTTTVEVYGMLSFKYGDQFLNQPVTLIGIDPQTKSQVGPLVDYLQSYHPQESGGEITAAERDRGHVPDWTLSDTASAYRQRIAANEREMRQFTNAIKKQRHGDDEMEPAQDPFLAPGQKFADPEPEVAADFGQLQTGRLYVGCNLISFPHRDETTKQIRTVYMVRPGDDVKISTVTAGTPKPAYFDATVVDVFKSGMSEYDSSLVFCNLEHLQHIRNMVKTDENGNESRAITSIQIKLKDFRDSEKVMEILRNEFPPDQFTVRTWEQKQGPLLAAVDVESSILNILLFLIITVAGFGILAIFFMIVVEKTRDIGILKALGASSSGVMSIFLSYGLSLGMVGSGVGVIAGLLFVKYINEIEALIAVVTGKKVFDEQIYYFKTIPTHIDPFTICWVALGAMTIAVLASVLPARRAARLQPVRALRYE